MTRKHKKKQQAWQHEPIEGAAERRAEREDKMLASAGYRKISKEEYERLLKLQADAILAQDDRDQIKAIAVNVQTLLDGYAELRLPSNDPEYLKRLQISDVQRNAIANKITQIDLVPDGNKTYLGVGSFQHHEARELAQQLADHFETKIRQFDPQ